MDWKVNKAVMSVSSGYVVKIFQFNNNLMINLKVWKYLHYFRTIKLTRKMTVYQLVSLSAQTIL